MSKNRRILIVDDNPAIHADIRKILGERSGASSLADARAAFFGEDAPSSPEVESYEIDSAHQGEEALAMVEAALAAGRPYALAFVDVRMPPGWDGIETLERLFRVDPQLQAVICTAFSDYSWEQMLAKLGRSDRLLILKKPFDNVEVQQIACALTEKWDSRQRESQRIEESRAYAASLATMNRALDAARAAAVAAAQAKSEFLTNMSHEIRTPMIAILGAAELLRDGGLDDGERSAQLVTIRREGEHLLAMLSDILDLSSIETGRLLVQVRDCSPRDLLAELIARHTPAAQAKGLGLGLEVGADVPEVMCSDASRMRQILDHLVANALRFTERGEVRVRADMRSDHEAGHRLEVIVEDTGIGITPEQRTRLFEVFSQADSSLTRRHGGAGLGLALSRRLAQVLGGDLDVESRAGQGSRFTLSVPVRAATEPAAPHHASPATHLEGRVLLVEDVVATQRLYALYLQRAGAEVEVCSDGRAAVEHALRAHRSGREYDLVLMDMQMPVLDGYEATRQLRKEGYAGPILAVTAHALAGDHERCIAAGCDDYVTKPVERAKLVEVCRGWIERTVRPALPAEREVGEASPTTPPP